MKIYSYSSSTHITQRIYPWIFSYLAFRTWIILASKREASRGTSDLNVSPASTHEAWSLLSLDDWGCFDFRNQNFTANSSSSFSIPHFIYASLIPSYLHSTSPLLRHSDSKWQAYDLVCFDRSGLIALPYYFFHHSFDIYSHISLDYCLKLSTHYSSQLLLLPNNYNPHWYPPFNGYNNPIILTICTKTIPKIYRTFVSWNVSNPLIIYNKSNELGHISSCKSIYLIRYKNYPLFRLIHR